MGGGGYDPENKEEDHRYRTWTAILEVAALRIDNVAFCHITSKYLPIFLFRWWSRAISSFI